MTTCNLGDLHQSAEMALSPSGRHRLKIWLPRRMRLRS